MKPRPAIDRELMLSRLRKVTYEPIDETSFSKHGIPSLTIATSEGLLRLDPQDGSDGVHGPMSLTQITTALQQEDDLDVTTLDGFKVAKKYWYYFDGEQIRLAFSKDKAWEAYVSDQEDVVRWEDLADEELRAIYAQLFPG